MRSTKLNPAFTGAAALLLAGALLPATPLAAQPTGAQPSAQETQPDDEVTVMGIRDRLRAIDNYVGGLTVVNPSDPLSRYAVDQYCPAVLGLSEQRNAEIAARMRTVAAAAGVRPAAEGCLPSALVVFVDDKASFLRAFRAQHPIYFTDLRGEGWATAREDGPAVAWSLVQMVDPEGMPVQRSIEGYAIVDSATGGSRLRAMVRPVVAMSVVIVERRALVGLTATQIADYVLMRTLTDRPPAALEVPANLTILGALTAPMGSVVPSSLTSWDLAYLRGRYSGDPASYGNRQRAAIRAQMRDVDGRDGRQ